MSSAGKKADRPTATPRAGRLGSAQVAGPGVALAAVLALAACFRLLWLGRPAFRADTIHFWNFAQQGLSPGQVWNRWMEMMGWATQFPLPASLSMAPMGWFGMAPGPFAVRLSDALFGILAAGAAWWAGREAGGRKFALFFGFFFAINPIHVQLSREAYFYSTMVAGCCLILACLIRVFRRPAQRWSAGLLALWALGLFLTAYSHFTGWIIAGLTVGAVLLRLLLRRDPAATGQGARLLGSALIVALPLTWLPWALPYLIKKVSDPSQKAHSVYMMGEATTPVPEMLAGYVQRMMWGTTWWANALLVTSALVVAVLLVRGARKGLIRWLGGTALAGVVVYLLVMKSQGMYEAVRHMLFLFPLLALLLCYGLWSLPRLKGLRRIWPANLRAVSAYALAALALLLQLPAAWASLRITGSPTPYKDIQAWSNHHLASGTPVLVDRWLEPWNELRVHPSTNVVFMFTRPNEPLEVFLQSRWREGAQQFLVENPDAGYMEIAKSYWPETGVGPWLWPRSYFKQHVRIANEAGLILRERGQAFREDFFGLYTNGVVVEVFFNTREDVLQMARAQGRSVVVWPGNGWTYLKSGPMGAPLQTPDFMDWRLMEQQAVLELYNLTDQPRRVQLVLSALAARGSKSVTIPGAGSFTFAPGRLSEWRTEAVELKPGQNSLVLRDAYATSGPLLVQRWVVQPVP